MITTSRGHQDPAAISRNFWDWISIIEQFDRRVLFDDERQHTENRNNDCNDENKLLPIHCCIKSTMSSNPNELIQLLLAQQQGQQQQQQQQQQQGQQQRRQPHNVQDGAPQAGLYQQLGAQGGIGAASMLQRQQQGLQKSTSEGGLSSVLMDYLHSATGPQAVAGHSGASMIGMLQKAAPTATPQLNDGMSAASAPGISVEQQQEHLLQLLATINPNLTAAVKHALAVGQANPHALQAQQPQQQQTEAPDLHHLRNLQPQQQQARALDLDHLRNLQVQAQGPYSLTAHSNVAPVSSIGSSDNTGSNPKMAGVTQGFNGMQDSKINSNQSQVTASTSTLLGTRSKTENASASTLSSVKTNEANLKSAPASLSDGSSPESLSLLTLQSWSIEKLGKIELFLFQMSYDTLLPFILSHNN